MATKTGIAKRKKKTKRMWIAVAVHCGKLFVESDALRETAERARQDIVYDDSMIVPVEVSRGKR